MDTKGWKQFQAEFLKEAIQKIRFKKPVHELASILGIKENAMYKKIQLQTQLSLEDLILLSTELQISLDQYLGSKLSPVPFYLDSLRKKPEKFEDYLENLVKHMRLLHEMPDLKYCYIAGEIPLFHLMVFPELFSFKLCVWNMTHWNLPSYSEKVNLDLAAMHTEVHTKLNTCIKIYYGFPGTEIWHSKMFDHLLEQIKYFVILRKFNSRNEIARLIYVIYQLTDHLELIAARGEKTTEEPGYKVKSPINVYQNEITPISESILIQTKNVDFSFLCFDMPHILRSTDQRFTTQSALSLDTILKFSTLVSKEGQAERKDLFDHIRNKISLSEKEILALRDMKY